MLSQNTDASHLASFYTTFDQIKDKRYDGMIITGRAGRKSGFRGCGLLAGSCATLWSGPRLMSIPLSMCAGGPQAGLYYHYGIPKYSLPKKLFGVFPHTIIKKQSPLVPGI